MCHTFMLNRIECPCLGTRMIIVQFDFEGKMLIMLYDNAHYPPHKSTLFLNISILLKNYHTVVANRLTIAVSFLLRYFKILLPILFP